MKLVASKHPKLVNFLNRYIIRAYKKRYVTIIDPETNRHYQAEVHRIGYYYDNETITIKSFLSNYSSWYVWYWDCFNGSGSRCEMWTGGYGRSIFYGSWRKVKPEILSDLQKEIDAWKAIGKKAEEMMKDGCPT